jgi:hypothetical protein
MALRHSKIFQMIAVSVLILCMVGVGLTQQKLDESCTVSVLNRTVRVNPDGSWVLPNIPANFGQVKARATCVRNGVTTFGESAFFTIPANGAVNLPPIFLGSTTQIPTSLSVTPAPLSFTAAGQTSQLLVRATYPDNSTGDVTAASTGTNYTTSNPAIATVSANGLVTAVTSGTVVIQSTNDGAAGIITANVVLSSTDSDGDGIPDDAEIRLGLDPHNPIDAQEDFDRDGLNNLQEFLRGTDIRNRDTDGDGLSDGDEVNQYHTNPLLADTDGDGIPDGIEIQTSTNPLDSNSFDLSRALRSIEVTPGQISLIVNTIIGEASQQLLVTGHLIDNRTTINLTSRSRGTNYSSSNLVVANFGVTDGLVFAGSDGTATITVTNNGFSATAQVTVSSFAPIALSFITIPGFANNVDVSGNFAYVAAGSAGLQVVDVTDRRAPRIVGSLNTPGNANDVRVVGNRVYVADGVAGLQIIDVTNPANPILSGSLDTLGEANDVVVVGNRAYIADGAAGLQIIDVSNPLAPSVLGTFDTPGIVRGVDVIGNIAVIADGSSVRTVNVSNPASPTALGNVPANDARDLTVDGNIAYLADFTGSLRVIDFSTPTAPQIVATTTQSLGGILTDVAKVRDFVFGADVFFVNGVPIVNVSTPANPVVRARLDFPARDDNGTGIAVDNTFVYLTADRSLQENGINGDSRLYIGQYIAIEDRAGIAPVVTITSPSAGSTVIEGSTLPITVQATDDVQVDSVGFLVNGTLVFTDTTAPYQYSITVPVGITSLTLGATASDIGGNVGVSNNVQINVIPDPLTTVTGRVVDESLAPIAGASVSVLGLTGSTGPGGTFSIPNVPTVQGNLIVNASFTQPNATVLSGMSAPTPPVPGGATSVGDIRVFPAQFEPNFGTLVLRQDDGSVARTLPFSFSFYGNNFNQVFVNNNGNLTFNSSSSDFTETISEFLTNQPRIAAFWDDLIPDSSFGDNASGLYINDQLPGRLVVTWLRELEYGQVPGPITVQAILFSDGRIQFGYQGVSSLDAIVGISPGGNPVARVLDYSATPSLSLNSNEAAYEQFEVPSPRGDTDDPGSGLNPSRNNPFDLDGGFILFTPRVGGGYDLRTALPQSISNQVTVLGMVLDANGRPVGHIEVEVSASRAPHFRAQINTDAQGHYSCPNVPGMGKIKVKAKKRGKDIGNGVGEAINGATSVTINIRPPIPAPPKN